jgi:hypothetical protein
LKSENTNTTSSNASSRNEKDRKLFDELVVTWFIPVLVAIELLLRVLEGMLVFTPVDCGSKAAVGLLVATGEVFAVASA